MRMQGKRKFSIVARNFFNSTASEVVFNNLRIFRSNRIIIVGNIENLKVKNVGRGISIGTRSA